MNYLAHLWLSDAAGLPLAGAVLGDLVRGRLDGRLPAALEASVALHRRIDVLTDAHPVVVEARTHFAPGARRYAGIVLDLLHDHCLARDWARYSRESLEDFAGRAAHMMAAEQDGFAQAGHAAPQAESFRRLLLSYADEAGMERALRRTASWLKRPQGLLDAGRDWRVHRPNAAAALPRLLEDLRQSALQFAGRGF